MYRTWCKYYPEYENPITGRRGRYLVSGCVDNKDLFYARKPFALAKTITITTVDRKRPGCVINPTKELKAALAAGLRLR